jgi:hypothetical protein
MPSSLTAHGPSAHSVPITASPTSASGSKAPGLFRERKNGSGSIVGISTMNQITMNIATPDVDHGIQAATSTG